MTDSLTGDPTVTFPPLLPDIAHVECAAGSRRDPDEALAQPCHVCGHYACRIGPQGPVPCETCGLVVFIRRTFGDRANDATNLVERIGGRLDVLERGQQELQSRIARATAFPI